MPKMRYFNPAKISFPKIVSVVVFLMIYAVIPTFSQNLETREIDLKGCIQTTFKQEFVIQTKEDFLKAVRNDASRSNCLKNLEKIDFEKHALLGIELNSGYCRRPLFLKAVAVKDEAAKQIVLNITYAEPIGVCRALSQYDLWVLVPKIPENYAVRFAVEAVPRTEPRFE